MKSIPKDGGIHRSVIGVALTGLLLCGSGSALADTQVYHQDRKGAIVALTDPQLAVMRGRFVAGNHRILYFGVEMVSQWQTGSGGLAAGMSLGIDRRQGQPVVRFQPTVTIAGTPTATADEHRIVQDSSAHDSRGVRQQIQVAGNDNRATNAFHVDVQSYGGSSGGAGGGATTGQIELHHGDAVVTAGLVPGGQVGVTLQLGNSAVRQMVGGGGSAQQLIQLAGDSQQVQNQLRLIVGVDPSTAGSTLGLNQQVRQAMTTLQGMH